MQGFKNLWLFRFASYAVLLVTSLAVQASQPDLFVMFCTHQPIVEFLNQASHLAVPLNSPVLPHGEKPK
jgi:hypothetical protein